MGGLSVIDKYGIDKIVKLIVESDINAEQESRIQKYGEVLNSFPVLGLYVVSVPEKHLPKLRGIEGIGAIHPNMSITAQMNLSRKAVRAEACSGTGRGVTIAILDTGISPVDDFTKPKNRIFAFKDFINGKAEPYDDNAHGTHVTYLNSH